MLQDPIVIEGEIEDPKGEYFITWNAAHAWAKNYPSDPTPEQQRDAIQYAHLVKNALPCSICQTHYQQRLDQSPPQVQSRESLVKWWIDTHNLVNRHTHKPVLSDQEALQRINENLNTNWTSISRQVWEQKKQKTSQSALIPFLMMLMFLSGILVTLVWLSFMSIGQKEKKKKNQMYQMYHAQREKTKHPMEQMENSSNTLEAPPFDSTSGSTQVLVR